MKVVVGHALQKLAQVPDPVAVGLEDDGPVLEVHLGRAALAEPQSLGERLGDADGQAVAPLQDARFHG